MLTPNLSIPNQNDSKLQEIVEELQESLTPNQIKRYLAAMLDGKKFNTLQKYIKNEAKEKAATYSDENAYWYVAQNWSVFH